MITVEDILREKRDTRIVTVRMNEKVAQAVKVMRRENISSVIVKDDCSTEGDTVIGVFSERDVTRALLEHGPRTCEMVLASLMAGPVISCTTSDTIETVMRLMDENQIRHLPVIENFELLGVVSATDIMRHYLRVAEALGQPGLSPNGLSGGLAVLR